MCDWHNKTGSALFGGVGGSNWEKLEKQGVCNLQTGDQILMKFNIWKDLVL